VIASPVIINVDSIPTMTLILNQNHPVINHFSKPISNKSSSQTVSKEKCFPKDYSWLNILTHTYSTHAKFSLQAHNEVLTLILLYQYTKFMIKTLQMSETIKYIVFHLQNFPSYNQALHDLTNIFTTCNFQFLFIWSHFQHLL